MALGSFGPAANSALPALTNMLTETDAYNRALAAIAIWHISSNESVALPVLIKEMPSLEGDSINTLIACHEGDGASRQGRFSPAGERINQ